MKSYYLPILLLLSSLLGVLAGFWLGPKAILFKPLGDIFLNLMFTIVTPLIFFSITTSIASLGELNRMRTIFTNMIGVFIITSLVAAAFMLIVVYIFPLEGDNSTLTIDSSQLNLTSLTNQNESLPNRIAKLVTVPNFTNLFAPENMLAMILFSILVGLAIVKLGEKAFAAVEVLKSGQAILMQFVTIIMYYAPIGFFSYFATLIGQLGSNWLAIYFRVTLIYYLAALIYFFVVFTLYAYIANKKEGIMQFWKHISSPAITALATCSSAASIPINLQATKKMGIPPHIHELVVPLGSLLHKDGTVLGGILKISFLFGMFHMNLLTPHNLMMAGITSMLVGTVMGAIPGGGMMGEMLILSIYGFPPHTLMLIIVISMLIDPLATMINVSSNAVCSMLVTRLVEAKNMRI